MKAFLDVFDEQTDDFSKELSGIKVPKSMSEEELNELPDRINEIVKETSAKIRGFVALTFVPSVDVDKRKVSCLKYKWGGAILHMN